MRPTTRLVPDDENWQPDRTGYALFTTRLGVCSIAWGVRGVVAVMLPDPSPDTTRDRVLHSATRRRPGGWRQALSAGSLSPAALQAVAGVQVLMAGRAEGAGDASAIREDWAFAQPRLTAAGMVLPDVRAQFRSSRWAANGLPLLDDIPLDWHGVPEFARHVYRLALAIAPGHTRTYGELAAVRAAGSGTEEAASSANGGRGLARAVGQALGANPFAPVVPCHRILAAQGGSGGFSASGGTRTKLSLLEWEGAALGDGATLPLF
ncbi:methylated-DNA--[protein]-cysteine S-methyltransferase [Comamonas odontotermitis]|uniref:methylated-DNA--[protein]-cysteine S-methyltransferase n=1 Tax=Comamonas odontotermitis TaxID=379895 RepID=UPI001CC633F6|nr:MGMT family protein [Comamonas odontotermitis]UBB18164.1 MGMT family protein [Comamonas odontotermitis]